MRIGTIGRRVGVLSLKLIGELERLYAIARGEDNSANKDKGKDDNSY